MEIERKNYRVMLRSMVTFFGFGEKKLLFENEEFRLNSIIWYTWNSKYSNTVCHCNAIDVIYFKK